MQSNYGITETDLPETHQHLTPDSDSCSPPFFPHHHHLPVPPILSPPSTQTNQHFSLLHHHHQQDLPSIAQVQHQLYSQSQTTPVFTHQFFQQWPQLLQPWQAHERREIFTTSSHGNLIPALNFKLGGDYLLDGNHDALPENYDGRPCSLEFTPKFCRQNQEYSSAKQPFCKDIHDIPNGADKKNSQLHGVREICNELEEIYGLVKNYDTTTGETNFNQLTGSGSALTGEANPDPAPFCQETEETSPGIKLHRKRKRKKSSTKKLLSSMAGFFESLVEQVMNHQDKLHSNFLEAIERIDRETRKREEEWRRQEAQNQNREAMDRVQEQVLASRREALILSYLEKITGQKISIPSRKMSSRPDLISELSLEEEMNCRRWPRSEVEALIQVRSGLEAKIHQEPGLNIKGPIWEEVSVLMASMGYKRSAKRCKEKWENINKYFRSKTKNSTTSATNKNSQQSKSGCSYFDQLDRLYSRINTPQMVNGGPSSSSSSSYSHCSKTLVDGFGAQGQSYLELLEAFTTSRACGLVAKPSSSGKLDFADGINFHDKVELELDRDLEKLSRDNDKVFEEEIEEEDYEDDDL